MASKHMAGDVVDKPLLDLMTKEVISVDVSEAAINGPWADESASNPLYPGTENGSICGIINMLDLVNTVSLKLR